MTDFEKYHQKIDRAMEELPSPESVGMTKEQVYKLMDEAKPRIDRMMELIPQIAEEFKKSHGRAMTKQDFDSIFTKMLTEIQKEKK